MESLSGYKVCIYQHVEGLSTRIQKEYLPLYRGFIYQDIEGLSTRNRRFTYQYIEGLSVSI